MKAGVAGMGGFANSHLPPPRRGPSLSDPVPFPSWRAARDKLLAALLSGQDRLVVTGPPGIGKTLLLHDLVRALRSAGWDASMLLHAVVPTVTTRDSAARAAMPRAVLVDEADRLSSSELQATFRTKNCAVLLAGLDSLSDRCSGCTQVRLAPLTLRESEAFVSQWLVQAGHASTLLSEEAIARAAELSHGIPRLLARLLTGALWLADPHGTEPVSKASIERAANLRDSFGESDETSEALMEAGTRLLGLPEMPVAVSEPRLALVEAALRPVNPDQISVSLPEPIRPTLAATAAEPVETKGVQDAPPIKATSAARIVRRPKRPGMVGFAAAAFACVAAGVTLTELDLLGHHAAVEMLPSFMPSAEKASARFSAYDVLRPAAAALEPMGRHPEALPSVGAAVTALAVPPAEAVLQPSVVSDGAGEAASPAAASYAHASLAEADTPQSPGTWSVPASVASSSSRADAIMQIAAPSWSTAAADHPAHDTDSTAVAEAAATEAVEMPTPTAPPALEETGASPDASPAPALTNPIPVPSSSAPSAAQASPEPAPDSPATAADTSGLSETPATPPATGETDPPPEASPTPPPAASTPVPSSSTPAAAAGAGGLSETSAAPPAARESDQPPAAPAPSAAEDSGSLPSIGTAQPDAAAPSPDMPRVPTQEAPAAAADGAQAARNTPLPASGSGSASTPAPLLPQAALELLIRRGDQMFRLGDVSGARLLYGRAAASGSSMAAVSMGRTFDPAFLAGIGAGISPDAATAAEWYRRATALGSTEAVALLQRVEGRGSKQQ